MATKKKVSTALAVSMDVPSALKALEAKIQSLKHIEESVYKSSCKLDGFPDIKTETSITNLIKVFSSIQAREAAYNNAIETLGLKQAPQFNLGGTLEEWKSDIQLRINIINHKEELDTMNEFKKQLESFVSKEEQKEMLFAKMNEHFKV